MTLTKQRLSALKQPALSTINQHLVSYPTPSHLSYLWGFGSLAGICLVIQIITGIFLAMHYTPHIEFAFNSVEHIMRDVQGGWLIRYIHANGASMFFIVVYLHIFRGIYYASYSSPREFVWCIGVIIFLLMIITAFIGYVLPWGQMSFWGATVITSLASAIPVVGDSIVSWLWGGFSVDNATLNRFFSLHYLLPFVIVGASLLHLAALHQYGSNNPLGINPEMDKIPFYPYFYVKDLVGWVLFAIFFAFWVFYAPNVLGHPDNYIPANPMSTPPHIVPEWYFLPIYAILRSIPDKAAGVAAIALVFICLLSLPFVSGYVRSSSFRPVYQGLFFLLLADCFLLGWIGCQPVEAPFVTIGQVASVVFFLFFLLTALLGRAPKLTAFSVFSSLISSVGRNPSMAKAKAKLSYKTKFPKKSMRSFSSSSFFPPNPKDLKMKNLSLYGLLFLLIALMIFSVYENPTLFLTSVHRLSGFPIPFLVGCLVFVISERVAERAAERADDISITLSSAISLSARITIFRVILSVVVIYFTFTILVTIWENRVFMESIVQQNAKLGVPSGAKFTYYSTEVFPFVLETAKLGVPSGVNFHYTSDSTLLGPKLTAFCDAAEPWQVGFQDPATPMMQGIVDLHHDIFLFLIIILVFVLWVLARALWHFGQKRNSLPQRVVHGTTIEILWTIFPSLILMFIAIPSFALLYSMDEIVVNPAITIKAIGHQWYWTYEYSDYMSSDEDSLLFDSYMLSEDDLDSGALRLLEVDNRVVVPESSHIRMIVTSADVLHSWAMPSLGVKCDAVPGRLNQLTTFIDREGVFYGQCSEICGTNHGFMPIVVESVSRSVYASWVSNQLLG